MLGSIKHPSLVFQRHACKFIAFVSVHKQKNYMFISLQLMLALSLSLSLSHTHSVWITSLLHVPVLLLWSHTPNLSTIVLVAFGKIS